MNLRETAKVLAKAAAFDQRTVGEADVLAWHEAIGDLDFEEAMVGVTRWYRDRADRLMPAHLREAIKLVRVDRRRAALVAAAESGALPDEEPARRRWDELTAEEQARLTGLSGGLLERQLVHERFPTADEVEAERFRPPKLIRDAEGTMRSWHDAMP